MKHDKYSMKKYNMKFLNKLWIVINNIWDECVKLWTSVGDNFKIWIEW